MFLKGIKKVYQMGRGWIEVLKGVDLMVNRGEFVAIMGPSGSGKSTLLNIIGCLDRPTEGEYLLDGIRVEDLGDRELAEIRNKKIGFIFQNFNLLPRMPAWRNVELPLLYRGVHPKKRKEMALQVLEKVGLADRAEHRPSELSGGEQQRVAIARAIVGGPTVLLADEPTGNLDSASGWQVMETLRNLNREGSTIILVTHNPEVAGFAERILTLKEGFLRDEFS